MTRWIEHAAIALAGLACALMFLRLLRFLTPAREALCRGPARRWFQSLLPWHWFHSPRCDYDLSGSIPDAAGKVICPECGTRQTPSTRRRRPTRWRTGRIALVLLLIALPCWKVRWIRSGRWSPYAPTPVLLAAEHVAGSLWATPSMVREELRLRTGSMGWPWRSWLYRVAIGELRDDDVKFNGDWAMGILTQAAEHSIPLLERTLDSADYQQRQTAAMVLMRLLDGNPSPWVETKVPAIPADYRPPHRLIEVAVEGLAADCVGWNAGFFATNHLMAFRYLINHASDATRELDAALGSSDEQQRYFASAVVAISRHPSLALRGATNLLEWLGDDATDANAVFAYQALWRMGDAAIPILESALAAEPDQETQRARTALLLIYRLRGTPITTIEANRLNSISRSKPDPIYFRDNWLPRLMPPLGKGQE
ncbi:MAG: hypothetical protein U0638_14825 [Phycisphaerales bacterium]